MFFSRISSKRKKVTGTPKSDRGHPIDSDEIEKFLKDIGFAEDQVCQVEDFAKFLLE